MITGRFPRSIFVLVFFFSSLFTAMSLLTTGLAAAQSQKQIFPLTSEISTPTTGGSGVLGDFNGDGKADFAYLTATPVTGQGPQNSINILLDAGNTASLPVTTAICLTDGYVSFVVGDVNNDKKLDVAVTCNGAVAVFLGNGDGTFRKSNSYAANIPTNLVLVDLNGDGYLDIATSDYSGTPDASPLQVNILLNNGSSAPGSYAAAKTYVTASNVTNAGSLASGDFNGDGKQDLITSTSTGFLLFFGNGDGTLQAAQAQIAPTGFGTWYTTGDFNRDGITDVAYVPSGSSSAPLYSAVQILLGGSSGSFSQGATLPLAPDAVFSGIAAGVLTSDGNLDLVASGVVTQTFRGDGKGGFSQGGSYAATGYPLIGDINGDGKPDLLLGGRTNVFLPGNGDGTLQGIPSTDLPGAGGFASADLNGDGVADAVLVAQQGDSPAQDYLATALGRGDGTFVTLKQSIALPVGSANFFTLVPGNFHGTGKVDAVVVVSGYDGSCTSPLSTTQNAELISYSGNGDGTFQAAGSPVDLGVVGASTGVSGDFNGDGKLDLVIPYYNACTADAPGSGLVFVPGNGDGTFGTPVAFAHSDTGGIGLSLLAGDLNNDKKLDLVWFDGISWAVYLANGDGTFKPEPLTISDMSGQPLALGDVNGDGNPDLLVSILDNSAAGNTAQIYAGKGDGTFQSTPLYAVPLPNSIEVFFAAIGDVNADGNPDLVLLYWSNMLSGAQVSVSLGDGKGNFTTDANAYFAGNNFGPIVLTRLNNKAPTMQRDNALDILADTSGGLTSLLNQSNPVPSEPALIASSVNLQASATSGNLNTEITLMATVSGADPTGSVSFVANGSTLGTATVTNGTATLPTSFANAGNYSVTANYSGDSNNAASSSNAVAITILIPITPSSTITLSSSSITTAQGLTVTVAVSGGNGRAIPTGTVTLKGGSYSAQQTLAAGSATFNLAAGALPVGIDTLTSTYSPDMSGASTYTTATQTTSVTVISTGSGSTALQFIPVTPCRVVDTRNATGPFGGPELAANTSRAFNIPQSACSIPTTAVAYSLNVTVVPSGVLRYLTLWPTGQTQPVVSLLNSDGRVKANAAIVGAGTHGGVSVYVTNATQVILDIDGYFVPAGTASVALAFYPLTPCRIADTRNATGPLGAPTLLANSSRAFPVQSSSCHIPSTSQAYSLNVTAVPHGTLGYLTTWPTGQTQPVVSTLNAPTGTVVANAAIVPAGTGGDISVYVTNASDVVLDVNGYFAPPATGGLSLYTVTPCRVIDMRTTTGAFNGTLAVAVETSACAPPYSAQAYVLNATVVPSGKLNYLTLWPAEETQPLISTLNAGDGAITSNMAVVLPTNGIIDAFSTNPTNLILDLSGYFAP
jgi:hypothetical protein